MFRKSFMLGQAHRAQTHRMQGALKAEDSPAPTLYLLWKDHKEYETVPPTRPVCAATVGPLTRLSEVVTIVLTAVMDNVGSTVECSSSEEMQRAMLDANVALRESKVEDPIVFSMDVKSLYPSLHLDDMLEAVVTLVEESSLQFEDIDCKELATYLAVMIGKEELRAKGIEQHIPKRTVEMEGRQKGVPGIAYLDCAWYMSTTKGQGRTKKEKWFWNDWVVPGPAKKKAMLALMMREMVRVLITNHHYTVDGKLFHQCKGGPIGERITTVLARMVLHLFDNEFKGALSRLDLSLALLQRYVDDLNGAGRKLDRKLAVEVRDGQAELVMGEEDTNSADDAFAAKIYQAVANTIRPKSITMEVDFPSNNPILDMQKPWQLHPTQQVALL